MKTIELGELKKIEDLRSKWQYEDRDFTRWLALPENLKRLSEEIGILIEEPEAEALVGNFRVDILAKETGTGKIIVIENQLEVANHDHLGKLITYASGYEAEYVIWIVKDLRDEHRQAIDWLNEHTDERINFFCIRIELWQINDSIAAPKFNILCQPNSWAKDLRLSAKRTNLSENTIKLLDFLQAFIDYSKSKNTQLRLGRPQPSTPSYYSVGIGSNLGWIAIKLANFKKSLKVDFYFKEKNSFLFFQQNFKEEIDVLLNERVQWDDLGTYKGATVGVSHKFDLDKPEQWQEVFSWMKEKAEAIQKGFPAMLNKFQLETVRTVEE